MNSDNELRELWGMQRTHTPDMKEMSAAIDSFRGKNQRKLLFINICLPLTSAAVIAIWYFYQPQMITTKIGIVLIIIAMAAVTAVANKTLPFLHKASIDTNIKEYLQQLQTFKLRQQFLQKTMMDLYFLLLTTGICLYLIEPTKGRKYAWLVYGLTLVWVIFNYFFTRPRAIKKQQREVDEIINKLEAIARQAEHKD